MKTAIGFAAHPDDLEFSCTATMKKFHDEGYRLIYVIITNGENGFKSKSESTPEQRIAIRKNEQLKVAELLGVEQVHFLDYRDGFLEYSEKLRSGLVKLIKDYKPEIVFSFDPANKSFSSLNLLHRDHRVAAEAVFDACFAAKNFHMYPGDSHQVKEMYFFASDRPDHFVDITDLIDFKLELLACHKSQFPDFYKVEKYIKETVCNLSEKYKYSEAFRVLEVKQVT
jgi:LmbE family N-acetylglucosaminyl deacetylase